MPQVEAAGFTINYEVQGEGKPLLLIPYRSRPAQPLEAFLAQSDAVPAHDARGVLGDIRAPTQITFGAHDICTSTRFAEPLQAGIAGSELVVFDHLSHAALHEDADTFNRATLDFLLRQRG
jgi:pimeloyl-ACP methyl ester carboxylesterase